MFPVSWRLPLALYLCAAILACDSSKAPSGNDAPSDGAARDAPSQDGASSGTEGGVDSGEGGPAVAGCMGTRNPAPNLPGSRDPDLLARAATVVGSCLPDDGIDRNLANIWHSDVNHAWIWQRPGLQAECLASTKCGCGDVKACIGWEVTRVDAGSTCEPCAGSVFCETIGDLRLTIDCSAVGLVCDPLVGCGEAPAAPCANATFVPACSATGRPQTCDGSFGGDAVSLGPECATLGLVCAGDQCAGNGAACTGGQVFSKGALSPQGLGCSGAMLDACVGGKHHTINCAERGPGFSCQTFDGHFFCGLASACLPGNEPEGSAATTTCEGNTVVVCNAGRIDRVDCLSLGFTGCSVDASSNQYGCIPGAAN
jgi:hypothetical protein